MANIFSPKKKAFQLPKQLLTLEVLPLFVIKGDSSPSSIRIWQLALSITLY
jgi:hypothetical protein